MYREQSRCVSESNYIHVRMCLATARPKWIGYSVCFARGTIFNHPFPFCFSGEHRKKLKISTACPLAATLRRQRNNEVIDCSIKNTRRTKIIPFVLFFLLCIVFFFFFFFFSFLRFFNIGSVARNIGLVASGYSTFRPFSRNIDDTTPSLSLSLTLSLSLSLRLFLNSGHTLLYMYWIVFCANHDVTLEPEHIYVAPNSTNATYLRLVFSYMRRTSSRLIFVLTVVLYLLYICVAACSVWLDENRYLDFC